MTAYLPISNPCELSFFTFVLGCSEDVYFSVLQLILQQIIVKMKASPPFKSTQLSPYDAALDRKNSLLKPHPHIALELPRFYSSDEKIKRKNIIIQTEHHVPSPHNPDAREQQNKRNPLKYSKTEKNETPSKGDPQKTNKHSNIQEKLEEALLNRQQEANRSRAQKKKFDYYDIIQTEKNEPHASKETSETAEPTNQNKIRYKVNQRKGEPEFKLQKKSEGDLLPEKQPLPRSIREVIRESKAATEEVVKNQQKEKPKVVLHEQATEPVVERQARKEGKLRTVSTFETVIRMRGKLTDPEREHLRVLQDILRKTIKNPNNLDFPEAYIVTDKLKFERRFMEHIDAKHQRQFKISLILTRLAFYLLAHFILDSLPVKPLLNLFSKLLEGHEIIMSLLTDEEKPRNEKYFSINKYSTKDLPRRDSKHAEMAVETRGSNLPRLNESVRRQLAGLFSLKECTHGELFLQKLNEEVREGLEDLAEMDKQLKWEVLKMPTSPFLPSPQPTHKHYLILDLDETLIHFNPNREAFQVRPFASQFLENLSRYYELTVFTAATKEYADEIINSIDKGGHITHRLYRNHLTFLMGESLKDISMLGRQMPLTLIVDNLEANFRLHPSNGILIKSWYGAENDAILPKLQNLLIRIVLEFPDDLRKGVSLYANFIAREIAERARGFKIKYDV